MRGNRLLMLLVPVVVAIAAAMFSCAGGQARLSGEGIEVLDPCGPSLMGYSGEIQEHFRHWAGGGSHLVFDIDDTIWTLNVDDGALEQVADADADYADGDGFDGFRFVYGFHADVLSGGSRIIYSSCEYMMSEVYSDETGYIFSEGYEIVAVNLDGTGQERLTKTSHFDNYPAISPDGAQIAFVSYRGIGGADLDIYHYTPRGEPFGGAGIAIMPTDVLAADRTSIRWLGPDNKVSPYPPVWSPDGRYLTYMSNENEGEFNAYDPYQEIIYSIPINGTEGARIGEATALPTWSPDSQELAFASNIHDRPAINIVKPDGSDLRRIWRDPSAPAATQPVSEVSWSPDGSELLFISKRTYVIRPDGSGLRRLEGIPADYDGVRPAAWSPDGSRIAIYNPDRGIITISPDGTDLRVLMEIDAAGQPRAR